MNSSRSSGLRLATLSGLTRRAGTKTTPLFLHRRGHAAQSTLESTDLSNKEFLRLKELRTKASEIWRLKKAQQQLGTPYVKKNSLTPLRPELILKDGRLIFKVQDRQGDKIPLQWLRDHCQCEKCVHPSTKQRLVETFDDIPENVSTKLVVEEGNGFKITWEDGHESHYDQGFVSTRFPTQSFKMRQGWVPPIFWTGESISGNPPTVGYEDIMSGDSGLKQWLLLIRQYGFCYVENTPISPEATQKLLERIAYIRNTHYGAFWDFTSDLSKGDTAYTQLRIGPHTDNTYFSEPAGLQLFHLLEHTDGEGGSSQLVDGFKAADELKRRDRDEYFELSSVKIYSHASGNKDSSIQPYQPSPVLVHDEATGSLLQVRWNNYDRASIDCSFLRMPYWYKAARSWNGILKTNSYWEQLVPGKALIFDNWRVLHGRSAFTGKRRMCGGYINRDDFISRFKMLNYGREEVLRQVSRP